MPHSPKLSFLGKLLRTFRKRHKVSLNQLSQAAGISRRTLARLESGFYEAPGTRHQPRLSGRTAMRLIRLLLPPDRIDAILSDATRLSRSLGDEPLYRYLDFLYDYPAVLFHSSAARALREVEGPRRLHQVTRDFGGTFPLLLRSGFGTRNLGPRLRAFRLRHDLTLVETAGLLEISPPQLYHIESSQRRPSPRLRFRLLRLLTLPDALVCHSEPAVAGEGSATCSLRVPSRQSRIAFLRALLSQPPPAPSEFDNDPDRLHRFRYLWLTSNAPTKSFAAQLGISPRHVLRLLRGDRRPSRKLRERIARLVG